MNFEDRTFISTNWSVRVNILYMDGHVKFEKIGGGEPMKADFGTPIAGGSYPAAGWLPYLTSWNMGGWG